MSEKCPNFWLVGAGILFACGRYTGAALDGAVSVGAAATVWIFFSPEELALGYFLWQSSMIVQTVAAAALAAVERRRP